MTSRSIALITTFVKITYILTSFWEVHVRRNSYYAICYGISCVCNILFGTRIAALLKGKTTMNNARPSTHRSKFGEIKAKDQKILHKSIHYMPYLRNADLLKYLLGSLYIIRYFKSKFCTCN